MIIQSLIRHECGVNLSKVSLLSSSVHIPSRSRILLLHFCINSQECQHPKLLPHNNLQSPPPRRGWHHKINPPFCQSESNCYFGAKTGASIWIESILSSSFKAICGLVTWGLPIASEVCCWGTMAISCGKEAWWLFYERVCRTRSLAKKQSLEWLELRHLALGTVPRWWCGDNYSFSLFIISTI